MFRAKEAERPGSELSISSCRMQEEVKKVASLSGHFPNMYDLALEIPRGEC